MPSREFRFGSAIKQSTTDPFGRSRSSGYDKTKIITRKCRSCKHIFEDNPTRLDSLKNYGRCPECGKKNSMGISNVSP